MENYIYQVKRVSSADEYLQAVDEGYVCIEGKKEILGDAFRALEAKSNQSEKNYDYVTEFACMLLDGRGCQKDVEKALPILMDLVEIDENYKAYYYLGKCYANGIGTDMDYSEAINWYSRAADGAYAPAQYAIGLGVEDGSVLDPDGEAGALNWFIEAAQQGYALAQQRLAEYFEEGIGIEVDDQQAFDWYQDAANQGLLKSQLKVGEKLMNGVGVDKDEIKGFQWYKKAAEQDDWNAFCIVADCYFDGKGVEASVETAVSMYRKAASRDYAPAQYKLGMCYLKGTAGVTQDTATAINYLRLAADQDDVFALGELDRLITELKSQERCIHCGGEIKGILHKCANCGIKKDY